VYVVWLAGLSPAVRIRLFTHVARRRC